MTREHESVSQGAFSPAYRYYALGLLVVVYIFNFIDRSILGILVEPIKQDLGVNDTMMGFLGGIFLYFLLGLMGFLLFFAGIDWD